MSRRKFKREQGTAKPGEPFNGQIRVWWIPQIPGKPFYVPVESLEEARFVLKLLAYYDLFQLSQRVKPDFVNAGGLQVFEQDSGDGTPGWVDWESADGDDIDSIDLPELAWPEEWQVWR